MSDVFILLDEWIGPQGEEPEVMKGEALTGGAFYAPFSSKDERFMLFIGPVSSNLSTGRWWTGASLSEPHSQCVAHLAAWA